MATKTATGYQALIQKADAAGKAAAEACTPTPMIVGTAKAIFGPGSDEIDYAKPTYYVGGGVCGFAWIWFKGNTGFGRWAKKAGLASAAYGGGLQYRVSGYGQSLERKEAYARAFAGVLTEAGITAYAQSRMD